MMSCLGRRLRYHGDGADRAPRPEERPVRYLLMIYQNPTAIQARSQ